MPKIFKALENKRIQAQKIKSEIYGVIEGKEVELVETAMLSILSEMNQERLRENI